MGKSEDRRHLRRRFGVLGIQEPFQKVQVDVLNDRVETFQSMPWKVEIESVDRRFAVEIKFPYGR